MTFDIGTLNDEPVVPEVDALNIMLEMDLWSTDFQRALQVEVQKLLDREDKLFCIDPENLEQQTKFIGARLFTAGMLLARAQTHEWLTKRELARVEEEAKGDKAQAEINAREDIMSKLGPNDKKPAETAMAKLIATHPLVQDYRSLSNPLVIEAEKAYALARETENCMRAFEKALSKQHDLMMGLQGAANAILRADLNSAS